MRPDPDLAAPELQRRLGEVFPPDGPNSPWLYRLAILRDDLVFEFKGLTTNDESPVFAWKMTYFIRRLSSTLSEAKNVWVQHVDTYLKVHKAALPKSSKVAMADARRRLLAAEEKLALVRDAIGGHVRMRNADPARRAKKKGTPTDPEAFERAALRTFADWTAPIQISGAHILDTSFRGMTMTCLMFAAGTHDDASFNQWHMELELVRCCASLMIAIDLLIFVEAKRLMEAKAPPPKPKPAKTPKAKR